MNLRRLIPLSVSLLFFSVQDGLLMGQGAPAPRMSGGEDQKAIHEARKSVVSVRAVGKDREERVGSGFVYHPDGFVLTRSRVVDGADSIIVTLSDGRHYPAWIMREDHTARIAILRVDAPIPSVIRQGESRTLSMNDQLIVIGNSMGVFPSLTFGKYHGMRSDGLMKIEIMLPPGNCGSPVLDKKGRLVGLLMGILRERPGAPFGESKWGAALPIEEVRRIADRAILDIMEQKGWVGISVRDLTGDQAGRGVLVTGVEPEGPAYRAGICKGDTIVAFEKKAVSGTLALKDAFIRIPIHQEVHFTILKNSAEVMYSMKIAEPPWGGKRREHPPLP